MTYRPTYSDGGNWLLIGEEWVRLSDGYRLRAIKGGTSANTVMENIWAFGDDDGSESGHSLDTENTARTSQAMDTPFMVRMMARETAGKNDPWSMFIYCSYQGGTWTELSTTSSAGMPAYLTNDASSRADEEATTHRLSDPAGGSFTAGEYDDGTTSVGCGTVSLNGQYSEWEFCVAIDSTYASGSEDFEFRLEGSGGTDLDSYAGVTYPKATTAAAPANLTVDPLSQANTVQFVTGMTQVHNLQVDDLSQATTVEKLTLPKGIVLWIDFEEGDTSEFDSVTGTVTVDTGSALVGTYGANVSHAGDGADHHGNVTGLVIGTDRIRFRIYYEDVSLAMTAGDNAELVSINADGTVSGNTEACRLVYQDVGGTESLNFWAENDAGSTDTTGSVSRPAGPAYIECLLIRASSAVASDGYAEMWLNGVSQGSNSAIDNYDTFATIDGVRLGGDSGDAGTTGVIRFDDFILRDDDTLIGPAPAGADLVVDDLSQANTVTVPTLTQVHNLSVDPLSQSNLVQFITGMTKESDLVVDPLSQSNLVEFITGMTQQSELAVYDLSQSNLVEHVDLTQLHILAVDDLGQSSLVEHIDLAQLHILAVDDLGQSNLVEFITGMTQQQELAVDGLSQSNLVEHIDLTQLHILQVDDLGQSNLVEHIDLAQLHILQVDDLSQSNTIEKVSLTQVHNLSVDNLSQATIVEKPTLSTEGAIVGYNLSQANTVEKVSLTQVHNLSVDDLSQATTVEVPFVNTSTTLTVADLSVNTTVELVTLVQIHNLSVDDLAQSNLVLPVVLTQIHVLAVDDLSQSTTVTKLSLGGSISIYNLTQASTVEKVSLTQVHNLSVDDLSQSNLVTVPNVNSQTTLTIGDLSVSNTVEKVSLTQLHVLLVDNLSQSNTVEEVILSQVHVLNVHDLSQSNSVPYIPISGEGTVTPFSLSLASSVETVTLVQEHNLNAYDLSQLNAVESIALVPVPKLVIYDLAQANSTDYVGITTTYNLMVYDLAQANTVDYAVWGAILEVANLSVVSTLWNSSIWQEQFEWEVGISRYLYEDVTIDTQTNMIAAGIDRQSDVSEVDL